jgi:hypothetical protein
MDYLLKVLAALHPLLRRREDLRIKQQRTLRSIAIGRRSWLSPAPTTAASGQLRSAR